MTVQTHSTLNGSAVYTNDHCSLPLKCVESLHMIAAHPSEKLSDRTNSRETHGHLEKLTVRSCWLT